MWEWERVGLRWSDRVPWLWEKNVKDGTLPADKIAVVRILFGNAENYRFFDWVDEQDFKHNDLSRFDDPIGLMDDFLDHVESQRGRAIHDDTDIS